MILWFHTDPGVSPRHTSPFPAWRPIDYGGPIGDPTFDYAPPSMERVRFHSENQNRRTTARSNTLPSPSPFGTRPPPPPAQGGFFSRPSSLWKMLAHKQRVQQKRPYHPRPQQGSHHPHLIGQTSSLPYHHHQHNQVYPDEAEIFPRMPNMVFFRPNDVVSSSSRPGGGHPQLGFPPRRPHQHHGPQGTPTTTTKLAELEAGDGGVLLAGSGENVGSVESSWKDSDEFKFTNPKPTVATGGNKEYLFTVVGYRGPTTSSPHWSSLKNLSPPPPPPHPATSKIPTILHAVKTTPVTITTTHNSVGKPFEPTESLDYQGGHKTHISYHEEQVGDEFDESTEESEHLEKKSVISHTKGQSTNNKPKTKTTHSTTFSIDSANKKRVPEVESVEASSNDKLDMVPPAPIFPNSFNILDSVKDSRGGNDEDDENNENSSSLEIETEPEIEIPESVIEIPSGGSKPRPVFNNAVKHPMMDESYKTSTSISVSVSKDRFPTKAPTAKTTSTKSPKTKSTTTTTERSISTSTTTTSTTTTSTPKPTKFPRLPTMPTYKKKTPVYARKNKNPSISPFSKYSSSSSSSALAKEMNGSGEIVVITAGRSKVKEYKPQFIGDGSSSLLAFDKVAEGSVSSTNSPADITSTPSPSTTTTKSPLQEFDPMKLLHSWFSKSSD